LLGERGVRGAIDMAALAAPEIPAAIVEALPAAATTEGGRSDQAGTDQ
jgi:hypothetical protein